MTQLLQDIRYAIRQLRKSPGFTLTVVIMLALGIGANTAIFTLVHGILLRSLPVSDPSRLIRIGDNDDCCVEGGFPGKASDSGDFTIFSTDLFQYLKAAAPEWIPAAVLFRELRALGYSGGLTTLKLYLATLKPAAEAAPLIRFETEPGRQLQADFATIRRGADRLSVFIATLGWSRATYVEFIGDEWLETLLSCHEHAFDYFGGVPHEVLYDNMHAVVSERDAYGPGRHRYNQTFLDFAHHYGFRPRLCKPYRPQTKGKVERFIRYLRGSFYVPLASQLSPEGLRVDRDTANARVSTWLREVANARVHATTGEVPAVRLAEEREHLQPLPPPYVVVP